MASAAVRRASFIVQVVATDAMLMSPLFAEPLNLADLFTMANGTHADFFSLMPLVIKFHPMFEHEDFSGT